MALIDSHTCDEGEACGEEDPTNLEHVSDDLAEPNVEVPVKRGQPARILERDLLTCLHGRREGLLDALEGSNRAVALVERSTKPFAVRSTARTIVLIEDDLIGALGPLRYDERSVRTCVKRCVGAVIAVDDRSPTLYRTAAEMVGDVRTRVLLIETLPERLEAWKTVLKATRPRLRIIVGPLSPVEVAS